MRLLLATLSAVMFAACAGSECVGTLCGACEDPIVLTLMVDADANALDIEPSGVDLTCGDAAVGGMVVCSGGSGPGDFAVRITAAGYEPVEISGRVAESAGGTCCDCGYEPYRETITLTRTP